MDQIADKCPRPLDVVRHFVESGHGPSASVEAHVRGCASCKTQLVELEADRKAFLISHPFSSFWEKVEQRRSRQSSGIATFLKKVAASGAFRAAVAMAGVAALMIVMIGRYDRSPEILSKGGVDLRFYVAQTKGGEPAPGKSGMSLPPETALQFVYSASKEESQLLLVGVEADGTLSVYFPSNGAQSAPIEPGDQKKLPQALRWQPKTAFERFFAIFSQESVSVDNVRKAMDQLKASGKSVEQATKLPLPYPQASTIIYKKAS